MAEIFISYKADDRARVKPLVDALAAEGLSVWWDLQIEAGADWRRTLRENLDAAACVIVVWSVASTGPAGHFVQDEASVAKRRGVYLPVAIDEVSPPLGFGQEHCLKLVGWTGNRRDPRFADVLAAARAVIVGGPRPIPKARLRSLRKPGPSPAAVAALAALALAGAGGLFIAASPSRLCAVARLNCPPPAPGNSIAVMPLADLGGQAGQAYFADGLTDELINGLGRLGALQVVGRTSVFKFKGSRESSAVIGQKLGVAYLLDGSVQRDGAHLRVSLSLIDAASGFERWSQTYDREMKDVFAVETGIAQDVAQALKVRLSSADLAGLAAGGAANPAALDAYLRGRQLVDKGGGESAYRGALAQFDAAIAADPAYATAHAARARALLTIADTFASADRVRPTLGDALASARRAVALAPDLPLAEAALGEVLFHTLDFAAARTAYARAMATGGGDAQILTLFAYFSSNAGDAPAAIAAARRATALDPLNPRAFSVLGTALFNAGRYADSIAAHRRELALNPARASAHSWIGDALYLQGRLAEAKAEYAREPVAFVRLTGEAMVLKRLGDAAGAKATLERLRADRSEVTDYQQAEVLAQWGQIDPAFRALDAAFASGDTGLVGLKADPMLGPLRGDPRFGRLLSRLGLTASPQVKKARLAEGAGWGSVTGRRRFADLLSQGPTS
jgi:serine/threonine-protein kinase